MTTKGPVGAVELLQKKYGEENIKSGYFLTKVGKSGKVVAVDLGEKGIDTSESSADLFFTVDKKGKKANLFNRGVFSFFADEKALEEAKAKRKAAPDEGLLIDGEKTVSDLIEVEFTGKIVDRKPTAEIYVQASGKKLGKRLS